MEILRRFNGDKNTKEALILYIQSFLEDRIIEKARNGEDVKATAEAINEVLKAFEQLDIDYAIKSEQDTELNQAA
jgi:hypothetical protein